VRHAWTAILVALLLASNAWWIATEPEATPARASSTTEQREIDDARRRVDALAAQVASAQAAAVRPPRDELPERPAPKRAVQVLTPAEIRATAVRDMAAPWIAALRQLDDDALRARTLDEVRAALGDDDPVRVEAALSAFLSAHDVRFDRAPFRPFVTDLLAATDPGIRASALWALVTLPPDPGDLDLVLPFADDPAPEVRRSAFHAIIRRCGGTLDGAAADAALRILSDETLIDAALSSFGVRRASAAVERRLLELYRQQERSDLVLRFGLRAIDEPSDEVFEVLIEAALRPGRQQETALDAICGPRRRARWDRSAQVLLELLERGGNAYLLQKLHYIGDSRHAERLERMIAAGRFESDDKKQAETIAASLRKRQPR
jgi:hypothetical protein